MSWISFFNIDYMEEQYNRYEKSPDSVESSWRNFFDGLYFSTTGVVDYRVDALLEGYRSYGHLKAKINPLLEENSVVQELNLANYGFTTEDLTKKFPTKIFSKKEEATLQEVVEVLEKIYCGSIGIEYNTTKNAEFHTFIQKIVEEENFLYLTHEKKLSILKDLMKAQLWESFLQIKFVGQKRFSLEGGETLVPMLSSILESISLANFDEVVIGMAHRGRINVLANIVQEPYETVLQWFKGDTDEENTGGISGDVKYHKGRSRRVVTNSGKSIMVNLLYNPSHLESVNPVVGGVARGAKEKGSKVFSIVIHGDASIAGQGVVYETLQLSQLDGYKTEGTLHIVINNQLGFTTLSKDGRSTKYCTGIASTFQAPVFHVNGEKPEECVTAARTCCKILQKFQSDVFIDLNCYRKYGHNESDEPAFTQPLEYQIIRNKKSIYSLYQNQLIDEKIVTEEAVSSFENEFLSTLQNALDKIPPVVNKMVVETKKYGTEICNTEVSTTILMELIDELCSIPKQFNLHPKIKRLLDERLNISKTNEKKFDWSVAEQLAMASMVIQGISIRMAGQDVERGTFSQRHSVWVDQKNGEKYSPLANLKKRKGSCHIFNSPLSEMATLGFEFGYTLKSPQTLPIWEAQYGDFANGAQTIIDQYIASSEEKWGLSSRLTLFLPHGFEGEGPEHSSARMERFLQLSANCNWQIVSCTTPAQLFHVLRRQGIKKHPKPLVIFTPKKLLRHPLCVSPLVDFSSGHFCHVIDDVSSSSPSLILLCSGKIYYDLIEKKPKKEVGIIRIEQLYPFPFEEVRNIVKKYSTADHWRWVQEEPGNAGAKNYIAPILEQIIEKPIKYVSLPPSSSTAPGFSSLYKKQFDQLIQEAFE